MNAYADMPPASAPATQSNGLPAGAWFPAGFPTMACGPPTPGTNGLNTSYLAENGTGSYTIDTDDPTSSPCNSRSLTAVPSGALRRTISDRIVLGGKARQ